MEITLTWARVRKAGCLHHPVRPKEAAAVIGTTLESHPSVVLSGQETVVIARNVQIGKSFVLNKRLTPLLLAAGKNVYSLDLGQLPGIAGAPLDEGLWVSVAREEQELTRVVTQIPPADVLLVDEVHLLLPLLKNELGDESMAAYNRVVTLLWRRLGRLSVDGSKMVFATAAHPHASYYQGFNYIPEMSLFFSAPVVELPAWPPGVMA